MISPARDLSRHPEGMAAITTVVAVTHVAMSVISVIGRGTPGTDISPAPDWIEGLLRVVGTPSWAIIHGLAAMLFAASWLAGRCWSRARGARDLISSATTWFSAALWAGQAIVLAAWGGWSTPPTALISVVLSAALAAVTWITGNAWDCRVGREE